VILIIGAKTDPHVVSVARALNEGGHNYFVLDIFSPDSVGLEVEVSKDIWLKLGNCQHPLSEIKSVWWRQKPKFVVPSESVSDLYDYHFVAKEWNHVQDYLADVLGSRYCINPRPAATRANNKLFQLQCAEEIGFFVPRTLVSNCKDAIRTFIKSFENKRVVFKTLTPYMNPIGLLTYTTAITESEIDCLTQSLSVSPGIFQECVDKEYELRVTVVGEDIFAAKINCRTSPDTEIDWRKCIFDDIYEDYALSQEFRTKLLALHKKFGLIYGAYDFAVKASGTLAFFEVNPSGQWMWLENKLGFPIGGRIASKLSSYYETDPEQ
jgi:glutathione synthase/RimK-type ligase-like ATP-grasp enzyme